jgi:hypothetical protein
MDNPNFLNGLAPVALAVSTAAGATSTASALLGSFGSESLQLAISVSVAVLAGIFGYRHGRVMQRKLGGKD